MKALLTLSIALLAFTTAPDPDPALLDKKWFFGYMRLNGQVVEPPLKVAAEKRPWMWFGKDKTYQQSLDGVIEKGIWSYNDAAQKLTTNVTNRQQKSEVTEFEVRRVSADSLELRDPDGTVMGFVSK